MELTGHRAIITGAARGIGATTARADVAAGADVALLDVTEASGAALADELAAAGPGSARFLRCDVAARDSVTAAFETAIAGLGGLDVLVNAAGVERGAPAEDIPSEGARFITRHIIPVNGGASMVR